jgi:hypothetical protein
MLDCTTEIIDALCMFCFIDCVCFPIFLILLIAACRGWWRCLGDGQMMFMHFDW